MADNDLNKGFGIVADEAADSGQRTADNGGRWGGQRKAEQKLMPTTGQTGFRRIDVGELVCHFGPDAGLGPTKIWRLSD